MLDSFPGCVMVAQQTLDLLVGVRILPGEIQYIGSGCFQYFAARYGPFVYRLGQKILNL
jgi:hypothetical protein